MSCPRTQDLLIRPANPLGQTCQTRLLSATERNKELAKFHISQHPSISKHPIHSFQTWLCSSQKLSADKQRASQRLGIPDPATSQRARVPAAPWKRTVGQSGVRRPPRQGPGLGPTSHVSLPAHGSYYLRSLPEVTHPHAAAQIHLQSF